MINGNGGELAIILEKLGWKVHDGRIYADMAQRHYSEELAYTWAYYLDIEHCLSDGEKILYAFELGQDDTFRDNNILYEARDDLEFVHADCRDGKFYETYYEGILAYPLEEAKEGDILLEELYNEICNHIYGRRETEEYEGLYEPCD